MNYGTGISGFIGQHLSKKTDIISIPHDSLDSIELKPFDYFYFLSSYGNLISQTDENKIFKANIEDVISIMRKVKNIDYKGFIYFSTSSVKLKVQTTYSRTKKAAEEILLAIMERSRKPITIIRPYSVTGVGEQQSHLIPQVLKSCFENKHLIIAPDPVHDFIDVEDVVDGVLNLQGHKGIFELGTGKGYTNRQVVELVEKITGNKANVTYNSGVGRSYDSQYWVSNNFKSRSFGWSPKKTLEDSIKEMIYEQTGKKNN